MKLQGKHPEKPGRSKALTKTNMHNDGPTRPATVKRVMMKSSEVRLESSPGPRRLQSALRPRRVAVSRENKILFDLSACSL